MAKAIWGIDFGNWSLKVVRGSYDKKADAISIDLFDEIVYGDLPCGYEASALDKHREGIIAFRNKYDVAPSDDLCVAVPGNDVFSRFINLPPVPEKLDEIIRFEARQQIPFDMDQVVWDCQPVREETLPGEEIEVGLFALKRDTVDEVLDLLEPWRGNLRLIQNSPLAVYNLLEYEGLIDEACVILDVGGTCTDVVVANPPRYWVRTLLVAGDELTNALTEQFGVQREEAEQIKRRAGRSQHRDQILRVLQPVFDEVTNEVQRSLGYYKSLARDVRFQRAIALGNAFRLTGMRQIMAGGLQYEVTGVDSLKKVRLEPSVDAERFRAVLPGLCGAVGLLVQGAGQARIDINMVPGEIDLAAAIGRKRPWVLAAAVGLVLVSLLFGLAERLYATELKSAEEGVKWQVVETARRFEQEFKSTSQEVQQVESKLRRLERSGAGRNVYLDLLPVVTRALPKNVYLTELQFGWFEPGEIAKEFANSRTGSSLVKGAKESRQQALADITGGYDFSQFENLGIGIMPGGIPGMGGMPGGAMPGGAAAAPEPAAQGLSADEGKRKEPRKSARSQLVMYFAAESRDLRGGKKAIEQEVFGGLRMAKYPGRPETPLFNNVNWIGGVKDIWRNATDGSVIPPDRAPGLREQKPGMIPFVAFEGYAVVNVPGSGGGNQ